MFFCSAYFKNQRDDAVGEVYTKLFFFNKKADLVYPFFILDTSRCSFEGDTCDWESHWEPVNGFSSRPGRDHTGNKRSGKIEHLPDVTCMSQILVLGNIFAFLIFQMHHTCSNCNTFVWYILPKTALPYMCNKQGFILKHLTKTNLWRHSQKEYKWNREWGTFYSLSPFDL